MKTINDYIVERIKVDNIKPKEFPVDGTIEDIEDFLKDNGFTQIETNISKLSDRSKFLNKHNGKYYMKYQVYRNKTITFADTSSKKISNDNPMYYIYPYVDKIYKKLTGESRYNISILSADEFKKEMENYFR